MFIQQKLNHENIWEAEDVSMEDAPPHSTAATVASSVAGEDADEQMRSPTEPEVDQVKPSVWRNFYEQFVLSKLKLGVNFVFLSYFRNA